MYQQFYSSSDAQIYLSSSHSATDINAKQIKLNCAVDIAYNLSQTSSPIFSLGNRKAQFYSHGNTVGTGMITVAFIDEEYLKYCLDYIADADTEQIVDVQSHVTGATNSYYMPERYTGGYKSSMIGKLDNAVIREQIKATGSTVESHKRIISIGTIRPLFDIVMYINNETAINPSDSKVIRLQDVKIIKDSFRSSSLHDAALMVSYSFIFKDVIRG